MNDAVMPHVPGLRSPYAKVGRLVYFGRLLDKIRLHAAGRLPADYTANLGDEGQPNVFDARCCRFLGVRYADLRERTLAGGTDEEILAWAEARGRTHPDEECEVWNFFMAKRGWRDAGSALVQQRIQQFGLTGKPAQTMFDVLDYDEGRDPAAERPWEKI
jgi:gluconokinase